MDDEKEKIEMQEDFLDEKPKKKEKKKGVIGRIFDTIFTLVLFAWIGICVYDYINVSKQQEPKFCIQKEVIDYEDGSVESCLGLGYRAFHYERKSYTGYEFGPFWITNRSEK